MVTNTDEYLSNIKPVQSIPGNIDPSWASVKKKGMSGVVAGWAERHRGVWVISLRKARLQWMWIIWFYLEPKHMQIIQTSVSFYNVNWSPCRMHQNECTASVEKTKCVLISPAVSSHNAPQLVQIAAKPDLLWIRPNNGNIAHSSNKLLISLEPCQKILTGLADGLTKWMWATKTSWCKCVGQSLLVGYICTWSPGGLDSHTMQLQDHSALTTV